MAILAAFGFAQGNHRSFELVARIQKFFECLLFDLKPDRLGADPVRNESGNRSFLSTRSGRSSLLLAILALIKAQSARSFAGRLARGRAATERLIQAGRKRIAIINGQKGVDASRDRLKGYRQALSSNDIPFDPTLVRPGNWEPSTRLFDDS
ncbi:MULTISPECIES: hypothetical protein [Thalassospira]|uniref:Uncharacterized protein n=1 Tax=Thalassospira aquimaris TaxID=3037796 RepID=A0ABT6G7U4_9PROT|nr:MULTISPECIES: hypothetical protein [Thalassospira]MDG4717839.1 hypothetical protein [Thalassospira sp. FZY0004]